MDAIETLMQEHRTIEKVIDALVAFTEDTHRKGATAREELALFVGFLQRFADQAHHAKEEDILFRAMADHGFPTQGGPIAVMLAEHVRGRAYIRIMAEAVTSTEPWTDADRQRIVEAAAGYAELLRSHIHKEDAILYPMAEQHLPPEAMEEVDERCAEFDANPAQALVSVRYLEAARQLVSRHAPHAHPEEIRS